MERNDLDETNYQDTSEIDVIIEPITQSPLVIHNIPRKNRDMKRFIANGKYIRDNKTEECVNCHKPFNNYTNFQGFCSHHLEDWNGYIYSCCGKLNKYSPGCRTSKHIHRSTSNKPIYCSGCRAIGHFAKDCPKDPNTRTGADPFEELQRISRLRSQKLAPHKLKSSKKYEDDDEDFTDIHLLKSTVKASLTPCKTLKIN